MIIKLNLSQMPLMMEFLTLKFGLMMPLEKHVMIFQLMMSSQNRMPLMILQLLIVSHQMVLKMRTLNISLQMMRSLLNMIKEFLMMTSKLLMLKHSSVLMLKLKVILRLSLKRRKIVESDLIIDLNVMLTLTGCKMKRKVMLVCILVKSYLRRKILTWICRKKIWFCNVKNVLNWSYLKRLYSLKTFFSVILIEKKWKRNLKLKICLTLIQILK